MKTSLAVVTALSVGLASLPARADGDDSDRQAAADQIRQAAKEERDRTTPSSGSGLLMSEGIAVGLAGVIGLAVPKTGPSEDWYGTRQSVSTGAVVVGALALVGGIGWAAASSSEHATLHGSAGPMFLGTTMLLVGAVMAVDASQSPNPGSFGTIGTTLLVAGAVGLVGGLAWGASGGAFHKAPAPADTPAASVTITPVGVFGTF